MREVGQRIRAIRRSKGLTLRQAAKQAELAVSTLSNMESGRHALSLTNLKKIATALSVPTAALLPSEFDVAEQRVAPGQRLHLHYEGVDAELLTPPCDPMGLSIFLLTFAQTTETPPAAPHRGKEYIYVIEGAVEGHLDDRTERLEAGDFVCFAADRPHHLRALGPARVLMIAFATGWLPGRR